MTVLRALVVPFQSVNRLGLRVEGNAAGTRLKRTQPESTDGQRFPGSSGVGRAALEDSQLPGTARPRPVAVSLPRPARHRPVLIGG